jgi:flagellar M-ring protein FliF
VLKEYWQSVGRRSRIGLSAGIVVIAVATAAIATWLMRTDYELLFGTLSQQDAAAMTAELDRMKVPYEVGADGASILVERSAVHQTRLKLMGKDIPLHGAVGFELFNNTDFGMTEFAQKINFQRAMQGEITRTIMSLAEVQSARVHLAFPEDALFKRDRSKAKASITLSLKNGKSLRPAQVTGIQRLVSAAVTGVSAEDVTIVDQQGVALTRSAPTDDVPETSTRLELKKEIEQHLSRKAHDVLERAFGPGRALASVDVELDMNQVRVTTEDVTGPKVKPGDPSTGVIVRERETVKDDAGQGGARDGPGGAAGSSHREIDYQVGRRVEQLVSHPGSIQRLQVLAVIKTQLDSAQRDQLKVLIGAAVGASQERGDTVVVQSMDALGRSSPLAARELVPADDEVSPATQRAPEGGASPPSTSGDAIATSGATRVAAVIAAIVLGSGILIWSIRRRLDADHVPAGGMKLDRGQREAALARVRHWLAGDGTAGQAASGEKP